MYLYSTEFNLRKMRMNKIGLILFRFKKGGDKGERKKNDEVKTLMKSPPQ